MQRTARKHSERHLQGMQNLVLFQLHLDTFRKRIRDLIKPATHTHTHKTRVRSWPEQRPPREYRFPWRCCLLYSRIPFVRKSPTGKGAPVHNRLPRHEDVWGA